MHTLTELKAQLASPEGGTIVCFGDSVTFGSGASGLYARGDKLARSWVNLFRERLNLDYPNARVINSGIGGRTMKGAWADFETEVAVHKPQGVIIAYGINDWNGGNQVTIEEYVFYLDRILEQLERLKALPILMRQNILLTDNSNWPLKGTIARVHQVEGKATYEDYLDALREVADRKGLPVIDAYAATAAGVQATGDFAALFADAAHPNDAGMKLIADAVWQLFAEGGAP